MMFPMASSMMINDNNKDLSAVAEHEQQQQEDSDDMFAHAISPSISSQSVSESDSLGSSMSSLNGEDPFGMAVCGNGASEETMMTHTNDNNSNGNSVNLQEQQQRLEQNETPQQPQTDGTERQRVPSPAFSAIGRGDEVVGGDDRPQVQLPLVLPSAQPPHSIDVSSGEGEPVRAKTSAPTPPTQSAALSAGVVLDAAATSASAAPTHSAAVASGGNGASSVRAGASQPQPPGGNSFLSLLSLLQASSGLSPPKGAGPMSRETSISSVPPCPYSSEEHHQSDNETEPDHHQHRQQFASRGRVVSIVSAASSADEGYSREAAHMPRPPNGHPMEVSTAAPTPAPTLPSKKRPLPVADNTVQQQQQTKKKKDSAVVGGGGKSSSDPALLRGITQRPSGKWQAQLYFAGKSRYIGVFDTREQAALAYEMAREQLKADASKDTMTRCMNVIKSSSQTDGATTAGTAAAAPQQQKKKRAKRKKKIAVATAPQHAPAHGMANLQPPSIAPPPPRQEVAAPPTQVRALTETFLARTAASVAAVKAPQRQATNAAVFPPPISAPQRRSGSVTAASSLFLQNLHQLSSVIECHGHSHHGTAAVGAPSNAAPASSNLRPPSPTLSGSATATSHATSNGQTLEAIGREKPPCTTGTNTTKTGLPTLPRHVSLGTTTNTGEGTAKEGRRHSGVVVPATAQQTTATAAKNLSPCFLKQFSTICDAVMVDESSPSSELPTSKRPQASSLASLSLPLMKRQKSILRGNGQSSNNNKTFMDRQVQAVLAKQSSSSNDSGAAASAANAGVGNSGHQSGDTATTSSSSPAGGGSAASANIRGITQRPSGKWQAQLYYAGKSRYIGVFESREKAAMAYEIARDKLKAEKPKETPGLPTKSAVTTSAATNDAVAKSVGGGPDPPRPVDDNRTPEENLYLARVAAFSGVKEVLPPVVK